MCQKLIKSKMKAIDCREQINDKQGETINFHLISTC